MVYIDDRIPLAFYEMRARIVFDFVSALEWEYFRVISFPTYEVVQLCSMNKNKKICLYTHICVGKIKRRSIERYVKSLHVMLLLITQWEIFRRRFFSIDKRMVRSQ